MCTPDFFSPVYENGERVIITERAQLLFITSEQVNKKKFLRIENQVIDNDFYSFLKKLYIKKVFFYLSFIRCSFPVCTGIFCGMIVQNLEVVDCGIDEEDAYSIIHGVDPYEINYLSLADNSLSDKEGDILNLFERYVSGAWSATIDFRGNCLNDKFKSTAQQWTSLTFYW